MERRSFLKIAGGFAGSAALAMQSALGADAAGPREMPRRVLGRTGKKVSVVGFPGLGLNRIEQDACNAAVHRAFEQGINYYDVAPAYGKAEVRMGIALQGIDRSKIFLACKTKKRDADGARQELERSLERLKTGYFDLYQIHAVFSVKEARQALAPGGAIDTILKAKEEGIIRHVGFSAHTTEGALAMMRGYDFDTVMFPINFIEYFKFDFGKPVLELAREQGAAVLAIKPVSGGLYPDEVARRDRKWWYIPIDDQNEINLAMRWALSQEPVVAGIPSSILELFDKVVQAGCTYRPITKAETAKLQSIAKQRLSVFKREQERAYAAACPGAHDCCPTYYA